jgi:hypothetical protein
MISSIIAVAAAPCIGIVLIHHVIRTRASRRQC